MSKISINLLIADLIKNNRSPFGVSDLIDALRMQGLKYEDGRIVPIKYDQDLKDIEAITNEPIIAREHDINIEAMVEEYKARIMSGEFVFSARTPAEAALRDYRNGLEDMFNVMRKKYD